MEQHSVFLYGYWKHNLGDDLFLRLFMQRYPDTHIYLLTRKEYAGYYADERITPVFEDSLLFHIKNVVCKILTGKGFIFQKIVPDADCVVILGGSLFMEDENWRGYMAATYHNLQKCAKKCYALGCNFGPYKTEEFLQYFSDLLSKMDGVCLRDEYSVKLVRDCLERQGKLSEENKNKIRYVPDIAFQLLNTKLQMPHSPYADCYVISVIQPENRIGLQRYGEIYRKAVLRLAAYLSEKDRKKPIVFFAVSDALGDTDMAQNLCDQMKAEGREAAVYRYEELSEGLAVIKQAKAMVATHFHTMLLAILYEVPVYPIIYNLKMKTAIADYGFQGPSVQVEELEEHMKAGWLEEAERALRQKPMISEDLYEKAQEFFKDTDEILDERYNV